MEIKNKKCSSKKHEENKAVCFCSNCRIYMCNKCENLHSELFQNHNQFKLMISLFFWKRIIYIIINYH